MSEHNNLIIGQVGESTTVVCVCRVGGWTNVTLRDCVEQTGKIDKT